MLYRITYILLLLLICIINYQCSSNKEEEFINTLQSASYSCPKFEIANEKAYGPGVHYRLRVKVIEYNNVTVDVDRLEKTINKFYKKANISVAVHKVEKLIELDTLVSYKDIFKKTSVSDTFVINVLPDNIYFVEGKYIQGVANGIPKYENTSIARPNIIMKEHALYTNITNHELGHSFGLKHTFQDLDYYNKGLNCGLGDGIPTTITPHQQLAVSTKSCKAFLPEHIEARYTEEEIHNMVYNFMSYSPYICLNTIDESQIQEIRKMFELNGRLQDCSIA